MNRICSFYRELEVGLLVWIHHNHGWYEWLMEEMGNVKWIMGNSSRVLGVVHHGLITWSLMRSFLVEFTIFWSFIPLCQLWTTIMRLNGLVINGRVSFIYMMPLLGFSPLKVFWVQSGYGHGLIVWMTTMEESCKLEPP